MTRPGWMRRSWLPSVLALPVLVASVAGALATDPVYGPELQGFAYPYPVQDFALSSQRQDLRMAYMDVAPTRSPNGRVAVLLHGKNFCAATWESTIATLADAGFRVIAPDQIGFCKSSKPQAYQFSFRQLAQNTRDLLRSLGVERATIIGHSTGGMLAVHYALLYPDATEQLVLVDPIGLEDWSAKGVPPISIEQWYQRDLKTTAETIRAYETSTYYAGRWESRYDTWVRMLAGMYGGPDRERVAWDSALIYDMIMTQPIVYRLGEIKPPTLLMIGDRDTTAIGKDFAPPAVQATLGHYPDLGRQAAHTIPNARLVEFPDLGHAPQISDPAAFHQALLAGLAGP